MLLEQLKDSNFVWAILGICTIIAVPLSILFFILQTKKKELAFYRNSYSLVQGGKSLIPEMELYYKNSKIDSMTITKYAIWNSGNEVLQLNDIVKLKPLKIISKDEKVEILDARVVSQTEESNCFQITEYDSKMVNIKFDYIDPKDGACVQIVHTGKVSGLEEQGKIKGGHFVKKYIIDKRKKEVSKKRSKNRIYLLMTVDVILAMVSLFAMMVIVFFRVFEEVSKAGYMTANAWWSLGYIVLIFIGCMAIFVIMFKTLKKAYYLDVPAKLRSDFDFEEFDN